MKELKIKIPISSSEITALRNLLELTIEEKINADYYGALEGYIANHILTHVKKQLYMMDKNEVMDYWIKLTPVEVLFLKMRLEEYYKQTIKENCTDDNIFYLSMKFDRKNIL